MSNLSHGTHTRVQRLITIALVVLLAFLPGIAFPGSGDARLGWLPRSEISTCCPIAFVRASRQALTHSCPAASESGPNARPEAPPLAG